MHAKCACRCVPGSELAGQRAIVVMSLVVWDKLNGRGPWTYHKDRSVVLVGQHGPSRSGHIVATGTEKFSKRTALKPDLVAPRLVALRPPLTTPGAVWRLLAQLQRGWIDWVVWGCFHPPHRRLNWRPCRRLARHRIGPVIGDARMLFATQAGRHSTPIKFRAEGATAVFSRHWILHTPSAGL